MITVSYGCGGGSGLGRNWQGGCEEGQGVQRLGTLGFEDRPLRCLFSLDKHQSLRLGWASLPSGHSGGMSEFCALPGDV